MMLTIDHNHLCKIHENTYFQRDEKYFLTFDARKMRNFGRKVLKTQLPDAPESKLSRSPIIELVGTKSTKETIFPRSDNLHEETYSF